MPEPLPWGVGRSYSARTSVNVNIHFLEARCAFAARVLLLVVENVIKNCFPAVGIGQLNQLAHM